MYHIKNDKRSKQSAQLIWNGLLKCLEDKTFDDITITDIQRTSTVARTTFYRCFDNLSDILYWRCDFCFKEALSDFKPTEFLNESDIIKRYFSYWMTNGEILSLLTKINRQDIIYASHMKNAEQLKEAFGAIPELDNSSERYFMAIRTGVTLSVLKAWLDSDRKETPDELAQILKKQLIDFCAGFSDSDK